MLRAVEEDEAEAAQRAEAHLAMEIKRHNAYVEAETHRKEVEAAKEAEIAARAAIRRRNHNTIGR